MMFILNKKICNIVTPNQDIIKLLEPIEPAKILGIKNIENTQIIFYDTPGSNFLKNSTKLLLASLPKIPGNALRVKFLLKGINLNELSMKYFLSLSSKIAIGFVS